MSKAEAGLSETSMKVELARLQLEKADKECEHQKWEAEQRAKQGEAQKPWEEDAHQKALELEDRKCGERQHQLRILALQMQNPQAVINLFLTKPDRTNCASVTRKLIVLRSI